MTTGLLLLQLVLPRTLQHSLSIWRLTLSLSVCLPFLPKGNLFLHSGKRHSCRIHSRLPPATRAKTLLRGFCTTLSTYARLVQALILPSIYTSQPKLPSFPLSLAFVWPHHPHGSPLLLALKDRDLVGCDDLIRAGYFTTADRLPSHLNALNKVRSNSTGGKTSCCHLFCHLSLSLGVGAHRRPKWCKSFQPLLGDYECAYIDMLLQCFRVCPWVPA